MPMSQEEVAQLLYEVGFRDDDLVAMVAIAGRESGYEPTAHRTNRDPSMMVGDFGLFQINYINDTPGFRAAVGFDDRADLLDPEVNARAAKYLFDRGGLAPWTAGAGGWTADGDPLYGTDVEAAREAVDRAADAGLLGTDYDTPDGLSPGQHLIDAGGAGDAPGEPAGPSQADQFVDLALAQVGDRYVANVTADPNNPDPDAFDCSELVDWAVQRMGLPNPGEATYIQYNNMKAAGTTMSVDEALHTRGALLFRFPQGEPEPGQSFRLDGYHVAISLGDGRTIEAMGTNYGVAIGDAEGRGFNYAATIPGMDYGPGTGLDVDLPDGATVPTEPAEPDPIELAAANAGATDADADMLPDFFEQKYGLAPDDPDTDGDGITDGYELIVIGTDASLADSDFDGLADGLELSLGYDPTMADNPDADAPLMAPAEMLGDSDGDGLADWGEELAGTDADDPDSDDDGVLDGDELMMDTDPLSAEL